MKRSPLLVHQRCAFAAQRLRGERGGVSADHDGGRMKLHEFRIGDGRARARGDGQSETTGLGRIGRNCVEVSDAASRKHDGG